MVSYLEPMWLCLACFSYKHILGSIGLHSSACIYVPIIKTYSTPAFVVIWLILNPDKNRCALWKDYIMTLCWQHGWTEIQCAIKRCCNSILCPAKWIMYVHLTSPNNGEKGWYWYCSYHMFYCISHMCSFQTCPTAKPSTAAVHIQLNLLEGSKGGEMTSRSTQWFHALCSYVIPREAEGKKANHIKGSIQMIHTQLF